MFKLLFWLYITCYACYIFYSREPDFFDGETTTGKIVRDNLTKKKVAIFFIGQKKYTVDAEYLFRNISNDDVVDIIYLPFRPEKAAIYSFWGYWFRWSEILMSSVLLFAMYQLSVSITNNPSATAITTEAEEMNFKKPKYTD